MCINTYEEDCFRASFIADQVKMLAAMEIVSEDAAIERGRELQALAAKLAAVGTSLITAATSPFTPAVSGGRTFGQRIGGH